MDGCWHDGVMLLKVPRWRLWSLTTGLVFLAGALTWFLVTEGLEKADQWASIVFGAVGAVGVVVALLRRRVSVATRAVDLHLARLAWAVSGDRLPRVSDVDPIMLGVKESIDSTTKGLPEYVARDCDDDLEWAISEGGMVLLHGPAAAGKSRTAARAVAALRGDHSLLIPSSVGALRALADGGFLFFDMVIWLDDLERYLDSDGLDVGLLHRVCQPGRRDVSIVATMRDEVLRPLISAATAERVSEGLVASQQPGVEVVRQLIGRRRIRIDPELSTAERQRATESTDSRVGEATNSGIGFGEYLIAGPAMMGHWEHGEGPTFLLGQALVSAAVDCRRAGYHDPVPADILGSLYRSYLPAAWRNRADLPPLEQGLEWASRPVLGASSCLIPYHNGSTKLMGVGWPRNRRVVAQWVRSTCIRTW
jgi:hypothetical protein